MRVSPDDREFAQRVSSVLAGLFDGRVPGSWPPEARVRAVDSRPGERDFLLVRVEYEVGGRLQSWTYVFDDWTDGALDRSAQAVAEGFADLLSVEARERIDTMPFQ